MPDSSCPGSLQPVCTDQAGEGRSDPGADEQEDTAGQPQLAPAYRIIGPGATALAVVPR